MTVVTKYLVVGEPRWNPHAEYPFEHFETPEFYMMAHVHGRRIDILVVMSKYPGRGHFRQLIVDLKAGYDVIGLWEIVNPGLERVLARYGFAHTREKISPMEISTTPGMIWVR